MMRWTPWQNKLTILGLLGTILLAGALTGCAGISERDIKRFPPAGVVLKVNGEPIRRADVDRRVEELIRQARESSPPPSDEQIERAQGRLLRQACQDLIAKCLVDQAIRDEGVKVGDAAVEARIRGLDRELREEGMTVEGLRGSMQLSEARFRAMVRTRLTEDAFWDKRLGLHAPTPEDVRKAYDDHPELFRLPPAVHLYEVFVPYPADRRPTRAERRDLRVNAEALRARLLAGESFAAVVRDAAGPAASARTKGMLGREEGDLGWVVPQAPLPLVVLKAAFKLKPGKVGDVIESADGFHILLISERREPQQVPFEKVSERLATQLLRAERETRIPDELARMRRGAKIEKP